MLKCDKCGTDIEESHCNACRKYKIRAYVCPECGNKVVNPSYVRGQKD